MAWDLEEKLVVGISSRALFDLEEENRIYEQEGLEVYRKYQIDHEDDILRPGTAFPLVKALHNLNTDDQRRTEIIIMSKNSADTGLRIFNSIQYYHLDITRAALVGGASISRYLKAFSTDLFLSANEQEVREAIRAGVAAAIIYPTAEDLFDPQEDIPQIRIAFDGDAVVFDGEADNIFRDEGFDAFASYEQTNARRELQEGPFAGFLKKISALQRQFPDGEPIRTALVTSRNAPAHERVIRTLRAWNVRIDEIFFLGGIEKSAVLAAFRPNIFFDDQALHVMLASKWVPAARVPFNENPEIAESEET